MKRLALLVLVLFTASARAEPCRLSLALGLDVSGSVDAAEYQLQIAGLAAALTDPDVQAAFLAVPDVPVALAIYEWSASRYQRVLQDWVLIGDQAALHDAAQRLATTKRTPAPEATGLAAALRFGKTLMDRGPACWDRTLDISGDGKNNDWPTPKQLRKAGLVAGLRVNALVVISADTDDKADGRELGELPAYFRAEIIQGPNAFVETARGFEDYARAMRKKLLKELAPQPLGALRDMDGRFPRRF